MVLSSSEKIILLNLFKSNKSVHIYSFYAKFSLSPAQLSRFTRKFLKMDIISIADDKMRMTEFGRGWTIKYRKKLFLMPRKRDWIYIPDKWKINKSIKDIDFNDLK